MSHHVDVAQVDERSVHVCVTQLLDRRFDAERVRVPVAVRLSIEVDLHVDVVAEQGSA